MQKVQLGELSKNYEVGITNAQAEIAKLKKSLEKTDPPPPAGELDKIENKITE